MPRKNSWGIPYKTCGVYKITNLISGDFYIGSSNCIPSRLINHFRCGYHKRKLNNRMYKDIVELGKENFKWELIEICEEDQLLNRESFYFENMNPTYNILHPKETMVSIDNELKAKLTVMNKERDSISIEMLSGGSVLKRFDSISEASEWINENFAKSTSSKTSNICKALKGKISTYYGFEWRYSNV